MGVYQRRNGHGRWLWLPIVICAVLSLAILAGAYVLMFRVNQFAVELNLAGEQEIQLEYGEHYEEPGAQARFFGTHLAKDGRELPVTTYGSVDETKIGTYTLRYRASYRKWSAEAVRTVRIVDTVAPQILLTEDPGTYVLPGQPYVEEGFYACDNYNGDITDFVQRTEKNGKVIYTVTDSSGNSTSVVRDIVYCDPFSPQITLNGDASVTITAGEKFRDPGATAQDNCDGDLTDRISVSGKVDIYRAGTYTLTYTVRDSYGNTASAQRTVRVKPKPQPKPQPDQPVPGDKVIYLTFDDGPGKYTRQLLEVLAKYNVKATFFVVNTKYVDIIKEIADQGHTIGIHTLTHDYKKIYASEEAYFEDLHKMEEIIAEKTGIRTTLIRFPGGSSNTVSKKYNLGIMSRLTQAVLDQGYQYFDWNVNSNDAGGSKTTEEVLSNVIAGIKKHKVSVVLQHDIKEYSVAAVEQIIVWGLENGYTFLPLNAGSPGAHHNVNN